MIFDVTGPQYNNDLMAFQIPVLPTCGYFRT